MSDYLKLPAHPTPGDVFRALATWYDENPDLQMPTISIEDHTAGRMSQGEATLYTAALAAQHPSETVRSRGTDSIWTYVRFTPDVRLSVFTSGHRDCPPACPHPVHS